MSLEGFAQLAGNTLFPFTARPKIGKKNSCDSGQIGKFLSSVNICMTIKQAVKKEDIHIYKTGCR